MGYLRFASDEDGDETTSRPQVPEALLDVWLLGQFPGRTLEELDQIDLNRLLRARAAAQMEAVEERRRRFLAGKLEAKEIEPGEWKLIQEMDALAT